MTYDADRQDAHKTTPAPLKPLGWRKVSDYGIESLCGRFRIGRYQSEGADQFALWDGRELAYRGYKAEEAKALAKERWQTSK